MVGKRGGSGHDGPVELPSNVIRLWRRLRAGGPREWLTLERDTVRLVVKITLAATLAWELSRLVLPHGTPALAALGAILTVQVTIRSTVYRGLQQSVGVVLGVGGAVLLARLLGVHAWSVGLVILAALLLGRLLRLGTQSNQVAISALLVLALGADYGAARIWETLLGASVGVLLNLALSPPTYVEHAGRTLRGVGTDLGVLLSEIGDGLRGDWDARTARGWLDRAREITRAQQGALDAVDRAEESIHFNLRARDEAESVARLAEGARALEHVVSQVRGITRTLLELNRRDVTLSAPAAAALAAYAALLPLAGTAVAAFGRLQAETGGEAELLRAHAAATESRDAVERARRAVPTTEGPASRALAAVLVDTDRLLYEVDPVHGAHTAAVPRTA
jgi:Aromatic acid exporter family member 1